MEHTHCLSPARAREAEATVTSSSYARLFPDLPAFTADEAFLVRRNVPVLGPTLRSRRPLIEVEQPAKPPTAPHAARPVGHRRGRDESIVETLMIPLGMIVRSRRRACIIGGF